MPQKRLSCSTPLILDTNVFSDGGFLNALESFHGEKKIPVIVYVEISIHFINNKGKSMQWIDRRLHRLGIEVEWLHKNHAKNIISYAAKFPDVFKSKWRDFLIASHAYPPPRTLITYNKKDFWFMRRNGVYSPDEITF